MSRRRGTASIGASPVLIGAATVLVALVAVFIAYNANAGLPFVPTYDLNAELPSGGKLVKGNEVRIGGFRVGVVKDITPKVTVVNGERRSVAVAELNLDKKIEPLASGHQVPRASALGARAQVHRARARHEQGHLAVRRHGPGQAVVRAARVRGPVLDVRPRDPPEHPAGHRRLRQRLRRPRPGDQQLDRGAQPVLQGADPGDAEPLRSAHRARPVLPPDRAARPSRWRRWLARRRCCSRTWRTRSRPSPRTRARSRTRSRRALRRWTSRSTRSGCSSRSWPTSRTSRRGCGRRRSELPRSLPAINSAFKVGTPVLPRTVELNENLEKAFNEANDLFENPNTLLALKDLDHRGHGHPPGARVHRAVPDGLQLLQLLHAPARARCSRWSRRARPAAARC